MSITQFMRGDIPMIGILSTKILLETSRNIPFNIINRKLKACIIWYALKNAEVTVIFSAVVKYSCNGNIWVRQRVVYWYDSIKYGCYDMDPNSSNL